MSPLNESFNKLVFNKLIEEQKDTIEQFGKKIADTILLIFDDSVSDTFWQHKTCLKFILNSRHVKFSIIIVSQAYFLIPKTIRLNSSCFMLFGTGNTKEINNMYEENTSSLDRNTWESIYKTITDIPHSFLIINYQNPLTHRLQDGFEKFIQIEN